MSASILSLPRPPPRGTFHCLSSRQKEIVCLLCLCFKTAPRVKILQRNFQSKQRSERKKLELETISRLGVLQFWDTNFHCSPTIRMMNINQNEKQMKRRRGGLMVRYRRRVALAVARLDGN